VSGHFTKAWEDRYFCLLPGALLFYFDTPEDAAPKGVIALSRDSVVEQAEFLGKKHVLVIKPNPTDPAARQVHLACDSDDETRQWTEALFKCSMGAWLQEQVRACVFVCVCVRARARTPAPACGVCCAGR
jgi:hypothetical protein